MPFESGTATNLQDLLSKLGTFAGANGWTVHFTGARTGGAGSTGHALILSRGVVQAILRSNNAADSPTSDPGPHMEGLLYSGTYGAASTETQPNPSPITTSNWMTGPYVAYHFFASALAAPRPYLHAVVEVTSGIFRHFGIGQLRQLGSYTNGAYVYGTNHHFSVPSGFIHFADSLAHSWPFEPGGFANNYATLVRADFGGVVPRYCQGHTNSPVVGRLWTGWRNPLATNSGNFNSLALSAPSAFTGRAPLFPLLCFVQADAVDNLRHPIGFPDDFRFIRVDNFQPGDTITLGSDTWRVFPCVRKGAALTGPPGVQNSWNYGYAYRQVP